jgi:acetoin utilization protein AcuC
VEQFDPQVIIRNGGSDPHYSDRLGSLNLTYKGLQNIGKTVKESAIKIEASMINMSCSGYNPETVSKGMFAILTGLMNMDLDYIEVECLTNVMSQKGNISNIIEELAIKLQDYWAL